MTKIIVMFFLTIFFIGTDTFIIAPLLPTLQDKYQITAELSGWLVGAYALGYALFALVAGPLSDGWNRKKVMVYGMLLFSLTTFLCGMANSFELMFLFRFLAGVSSAFVGPQIWASIPTLFAPKQIGKVMGIVMAGLSISQLLGVPLGSLLASYHWSVPFYLIGAASFLIGLLNLYIIPDIHPSSLKHRKDSILDRYLTLLQARKSKPAFLGYFLLMMGGYALTSFIGNWLTDSFGQTLSGLGLTMLIVGFGNTLGSFASGWVIERFGRPATIAASTAGLVLMYFILPFFPLLWQVQAALFLCFGLTGVLVPVLMGLLQSLSPEARGTISSFANATMYTGALLGSAFAGYLYTHIGFLGISLYTSFCILFSLFFFLRVESSKQMASQM